MTRPDGFPIADVDVGLLSDDRILDAVSDAGSDAVVAYLAILTESWARGERVTYTNAVTRLPRVYRFVDEGDEQRDPAMALMQAGLLDADERIPASTWASWFKPAAERRELRRELGRRGGLAKAARASQAKGETNGRKDAPASKATSRANGVTSSPALPDRPSVVALRATDGSVDPPAPGRAREGPDRNAIACRHYDTHRSEHYWWEGVGWRCPTCDQEDKELDTMTLRQKVERASGESSQ